MSERDYNKLIARFKELSDNPKFDYQPEDWSAVEKMLDKPNKNRPLVWFLLSGLLVISVVATWLIISDAKISQLADYQYRSAKIDKDQVYSDTVKSGVHIVGQQGDSSSKKSEIAQHLTRESSALVSTTSKAAQFIKSEVDDITQLTSVDGDMGGHTSLQVLNDPKSDILDSKSDRYSVQSLSEDIHVESELLIDGPSEDQNGGLYNGQSDLKHLGNSNTDELSTHEPVGYVIGYSINNTTIIAGNSSIYGVPSKTIAPLVIDDVAHDITMTFGHNPKEVLEEHRPRWILNANIGVESAQSPLGGRSDVDYSVGLRLGYVVGPKLSINVGANYIREGYEAQGEDYIPPVGFWSGSEGVPPEEIQAVCDMLDLSIGASYHFTDIQSNGLVAHVNLLSNFMLREEYDYQFDESSDDFTNVFTGENHNFASQIELSTAYKLRTGGGYFIDAGPYLKLPLRGVGHGNVRLTSVGIRIGVSLVK